MTNDLDVNHPDLDVRRPDPLKATSVGRDALEVAFLRSKASEPASNRHSESDQKEADTIEAALLATLPASEIEGVGPGGELRLSRPQALDEQARRIRNTLQRPNRVTTSAELERLRQADAAACIDTAMDMADTIGAQNNLERSLAHQLAAAHNLAMRFSGLALAHGEKSWPATRRVDATPSDVREHAVEAARLAHAAARMMAAYQEGALALAKIRSGGRQTVVVQYVHVNQGGQAVVAGSIRSPRKGGALPSQSAPSNQPEPRPEDRR